MTDGKEGKAGKEGKEGPGLLRRLVSLVLVLLLLLVVALFVKMLATPSRQLPPPIATGPLPQLSDSEQQQAAERLAQAIRIATISSEGAPPSAESLRALHAHLTTSFPLVHSTLRRETVNDFSLLYTWPGSDPNLKPILLLAHQDVVPVEAGSESRWQKPPFSGAIDGGFIWGRGALDDKASLIGILEAVERLLRAGYKPRRSIYLAFGHDEEVNGAKGAVALADLLQKRGLRFEYVLDEGQAVTLGIMPGVKPMAAMIGLAEKGYLSAELLVSAKGGHSSMPPPHTAVGILAQAITRLERQPMPTAMRGPTRKLFETMGPDLSFPLRLVMTNLWLLEPLVLYQMGQDPTTNSVIRTTTAVTMIEGSPKDNVLPQRARAVVNFRLYPGDSSEKVLRHVRDAVADPRVEVRAIAESLHEATPESSEKTAAFALVAGTIRQVFPGSLVAPSLNGGAADARHYVQLSDNVYRFGPLFIQREDLSRFHGTDERIAVADHTRGIVFFEQLLRNGDQAP